MGLLSNKVETSVPKVDSTGDLAWLPKRSWEGGDLLRVGLVVDLGV